MSNDVTECCFRQDHNSLANNRPSSACEKFGIPPSPPSMATKFNAFGKALIGMLSIACLRISLVIRRVMLRRLFFPTKAGNVRRDSPSGNSPRTTNTALAFELPMNWTGALSVVFGALFVPSAYAQPVWMVVGDSTLIEGIEPLIEARRAQGFQVVTAEPPIEEALKSAKVAPDYLLLVGDDVLTGQLADGETLPGVRRKLYRWQATQPEDFISDAIYGDRDGDGVPELPVGRLPVRSAVDAKAIAAKIIAYEQLKPLTAHLRIPVWAGNPNYGDLFQASMASNLLRQTLQSHAPPWADLWLMMGSSTDPLCGAPRAHPDLFNAMLANVPAAFIGMMGHGNAEAFYSMPVGRKWVVYNHQHAHRGLAKAQTPAAPTVIFACDCGNFGHGSVSLAEALLSAPAGPVAVLAATTQSHPLPNYYSSVSLLQRLGEAPPRLGNLWVKTQQEGYTMKNPLVEWALKEVEGKLEAELDTPRIRKDHVLLYALLGDPATKLHLPQPMEVIAELKDDAWQWRLPKPSGARKLEIGHREPFAMLKARPADLPDDEAMKLFNETNAKLSFQPVVNLKSDQIWEGSLPNRPGTYRFVVHHPDGLRVATKRIP